MTDTLSRFWSKVDKTGSCWLWKGATQSKGYGHLWVSGKDTLAHRHSWALANGPIPPGAVIDHRCRVLRCVNPSHMDVVTPRENTIRGIGPTAVNSRKNRCPRGHAYTRVSGGKRSCRICPHRKGVGK